MLELSLDRRVMIIAKGYWALTTGQLPFWEYSMDDFIWFSQSSEVYVNIIFIITDERQGRLNQAEKGTMGKAFWAVVLTGWSRDMEEQQINGTGSSSEWLEQKCCVGKWYEMRQAWQSLSSGGITGPPNELSSTKLWPSTSDCIDGKQIPLDSSLEYVLFLYKNT